MQPKHQHIHVVRSEYNQSVGNIRAEFTHHICAESDQLFVYKCTEIAQSFRGQEKVGIRWSERQENVNQAWKVPWWVHSTYFSSIRAVLFAIEGGETIRSNRSPYLSSLWSGSFCKCRETPKRMTNAHTDTHTHMRMGKVFLCPIQLRWRGTLKIYV